MPKTPAQRVREVEASRRARGEREVRLWLPDDPDTIQRFRDEATKACREAQAKMMISTLNRHEAESKTG